jgi:hypothetical protein
MRLGTEPLSPLSVTESNKQFRNSLRLGNDVLERQTKIDISHNILKTSMHTMQPLSAVNRTAVNY